MIVPHYNNKQPLGVTSLVVLTAKALFLTLVMTAVVSLMFLVSVFMARPATATTMNPASMVDWIATYNYDYLNGYLAGSPCTQASHYTKSPAITRWIASSYHPKVTSITVPYGTASVDLKFHLAGSQCWNSVGVDTYSIIQSISASAGSISPPLPDNAILRMNFAPPTSAGRTLMSSTGVFTYTPTGGFTTSGTHIVTVYAKEGNLFSNGGSGCVADLAPPADGYFSNCPTGASTVSIFVTVSDAPPNIAVYSDCGSKRVAIQTNDPNAGNLGMYYKIYEDGTAEPTNWTTPSPATYNVAANINATWYIDMSTWDQTKKWRVRAFTPGVGLGGTSPSGSSIREATATYGPCPVIAGRVYDATTGAGISGVTISCNNGIWATTDANGHYEFTSSNIAVFTTYCLRPTLPAGSLYKLPAIVAPSYPGVGSNTPPPYPGDGNVLQYGYLLYCYANSTTSPPCTIAGTADESYEYQVAAGACYQNPQYCGAGKIGTSDYVLTHDRATDIGMDFVYELINPPSYPWLQTTGGNVVANGKITGNPASDSRSGARPTTNTDKEVEFLIISKVGGGGPFCSRKNYILTNASATTGDCGNGTGYTVLNTYSLNDTEDKVVAGVKDAYDTLEPACQRTTDTVSNIVTNVPDSCTDGAIVKYSGASLASYSLTKGRVTILVEGDLTIGVGVGYGTNGYDNLKDVPNLAIVVKGNVTVLGAATLVGASIYATGTISTCDTAPTTFCSSQLVINGFLSAQSGFIFGRGFTNTTARTAAEVINLTLQSVVFPPPGIDYGSVFKGDSSVKIDSSEYQPRF